MIITSDRIIRNPSMTRDRIITKNRMKTNDRTKNLFSIKKRNRQGPESSKDLTNLKLTRMPNEKISMARLNWAVHVASL